MKENLSRTSWFLTMTADFVCTRTGLDWFDRLHSLPSIYGIPVRTYAHVMHVDVIIILSSAHACALEKYSSRPQIVAALE